MYQIMQRWQQNNHPHNNRIEKVYRHDWGGIYSTRNCVNDNNFATQTNDISTNQNLFQIKGSTEACGNLSLKALSSLAQKKLRENTYQRMDFAVPVGHGVKLKENKKLEKYQVRARKLVNVRNIKVKIVPIVTGHWQQLQK